jgi:PGF-CTERM protein
LYDLSGFENVRTEYVLLGVVGLAVVLGVGIAVGVPDAIDPPEDAPGERERPGHVSLIEMTIGPGAVGGENATLRVRPHVQQRGGPAENVTVLLRAIDHDTGFVAATQRLSYGDLDDDVTRIREGVLTVAREGGYDVESIVYVNGTRVERGTRAVRGVDTLTPNYRDTPLRFQSFDADIPVIEYRIESVTENRSTLSVSTYLTNTGDRPAGDLELVLTARQNGSNVVADRTTVQADSIGSGKTATPTGELVVPDDYNYYLDAVLWRDGTVLATARSTANLAPGTGLQVDEDASRGEGFEADEFEAQEAGGDGQGTERPDEGTESGSGGQPGFGVGVALAALVAATLIARTRA